MSLRSTLTGREFKTVREISGPLLFVEAISGIHFGELVQITTPSGEERRGQVLELGEM